MRIRRRSKAEGPKSEAATQKGTKSLAFQVTHSAQPRLRDLGDVLRLLPEPGNPRWRQRMADDIGLGRSSGLRTGFDFGEAADSVAEVVSPEFVECFAMAVP